MSPSPSGNRATSLAGVLRRLRILLLPALVILFVVSLWTTFAPAPVLRVSAGSTEGARTAKLRELATRAGLKIEVVSTAGSEAALDGVASGELDAALVQGEGYSPAGAFVLASLDPEPLHIVAAPDVHSLEDLTSRTVFLGPVGSGTRRLSTELLDFVGADGWVEFESDYARLAQGDVPDLIFTVQPSPNDLVESLLARGYHLLDAPFGVALGARDPNIVPVVIPAYSYGLRPAAPRNDVNTIGNPTVLVANEYLDDDAGVALLVAAERLFHGMTIGRYATLPPHEGALRYGRRNSPLVTPEIIEGVENLRSLIVSVAVAGYFIFVWWRRRGHQGFDQGIARVSQIERRLVDMELSPDIPFEELLRLRHELMKLKARLLEDFADGRVRGEEMMVNFLIHVGSVREHADEMILHERERLEKDARTTGQDHDALWLEALGGLREKAMQEEAELRRSRTEPNAQSRLPLRQFL